MEYILEQMSQFQIDMPHIMSKDGNGLVMTAKEEPSVRLINQTHFIENASEEILMLEMKHL